MNNRILKGIALILFTLILLLGLVGCNKGTDTMYVLGIMVDGVFYEKAYQPMPAEIDESAIIGHVAYYTDTFPTKDGETNISADLIGAPYARVEGGIALLWQNEWYLCTPESAATDETETVSFHKKILNKSDLSEETIQWLEWYNNLSETEQLSVSHIPNDLYKLCGYDKAENTPAKME